MKTNTLIVAAVLAFCCIAIELRGQEGSHEASLAKPLDQETIKQGIQRALPWLEKASAGSAEQRQCFTCHSQALPVFVFEKALDHGFPVDKSNLKRQIEHARDHLKRGLDTYREGKPQGGGIDTAGYALWTLEDGGMGADDVTDAVVQWMLGAQSKHGFWRPTSARPPTQGSRFTSTYLAIRALSVFGREGDHGRIHDAKKLAANWLLETSPSDLEDRVFQLLLTNYLEISEHQVRRMSEALIAGQKNDGGWSQLDDMETDSYATATALYALERTGLPKSTSTWQLGLKYLLERQREDGTWHVATRSKPIQKYFETGFPHEKDQFISSYASGWATLCLLSAVSVSETK